MYRFYTEKSVSDSVKFSELHSSPFFKMEGLSHSLRERYESGSEYITHNR